MIDDRDEEGVVTGYVTLDGRDYLITSWTHRAWLAIPAAERPEAQRGHRGWFRVQLVGGGHHADEPLATSAAAPPRRP